LLEEDTFMRGMLVNEHKTLGTFRNKIKLRHAADDVQTKPVRDERFGTRGWTLRQQFFGKRKRRLQSERFRFLFQLQRRSDVSLRERCVPSDDYLRRRDTSPFASH
jgi:hypothetical protein